MRAGANVMGLEVGRSRSQRLITCDGDREHSCRSLFRSSFRLFSSFLFWAPFEGFLSAFCGNSDSKKLFGQLCMAHLERHQAQIGIEHRLTNMHRKLKVSLLHRVAPHRPGQIVLHNMVFPLSPRGIT